MKSFAQALIPCAALLSATLAAPTPASSEPSFPITDLIGTEYTIDEYVRVLEGQSSADSTLAKRQFNGDTYNQLTDGTPCREVTLIYARGTTQDGNVGDAASEGPTFFNAVASRLGGTSRLAVQGVTYAANIFGFLAGGDAAGATTMFNLINTVRLDVPRKFRITLTCQLGCIQVPEHKDRCIRLQPGCPACAHRDPEAVSSDRCKGERRWV
jgi:cutinase